VQRGKERKRGVNGEQKTPGKERGRDQREIQRERKKVKERREDYSVQSAERKK